MELAGLLYDLLKTGAGLMASGAAVEFAKSGGKAAFEALRDRLTGKHGVETLNLIGKAGSNPAFAEAIKSDLAKSMIAEDAEIPRLLDDLRAEIAKLPKNDPRYALDIREGIEAAGNMTLEDIEGIRTQSLKSGGDMMLKGIKAPPGK